MPLDTAPVPLPHYCRQTYPLPPDARYVLDNMLDDWGLDEGSYMALNLFVPRLPILALLDASGTGDVRIGLHRREMLSEQLLDLVDATLPDLPDEVRSGLGWASLAWLRRDFYGLAKVYSDWAHEDEIVGGCMKKFLRVRRIRRNGEVYPRTMRRLLSPAFIARFVKQQRESMQRRRMATRILNRVERVGDPVDCLGGFAEEMAAQRERARQEAYKRFRTLGSVKDINPAMERKLLRKRRGVIKRSLNFASAVLSADQIRTFAHGKAVRISGQTLDLLVSPTGGMADCGHGALHVEAAAPGGQALASLCTYQDKTPALDQLASLSLAMGAGEEAEIISVANIVQMHPGGREHPLLAERENRHIAVGAERRAAQADNWTVIDRSWWSYGETRNRQRSYWDATKHIWLERLAVFACGRRVKMLGAVA